MSHSIQDLENIASQLKALGESRFELDFWLKIFDDLNAETKEALMKNLGGELKALEEYHN